MKIALGSTSDSKIAILKDVLTPLVKEELTISGYDVNSGITDQPLTEEETVKGAITRAKDAMSKSKDKPEIAVGMEGGLQKIADKGYFLVCVVAIVDFDGHLSLGLGGKLQLPVEVSKGIENDGQFGQLIRDYENKHKNDNKVKPLVRALISRNTAFEEALRNAYLSFQNKSHY